MTVFQFSGVVEDASYEVVWEPCMVDQESADWEKPRSERGEPEASFEREGEHDDAGMYHFISSAE
jgi:hypothetical protein